MPRAQQTLEAYCGNLERATGAQMAIVLVDTLDDEPVEDVANRLYREWGIGKKGKDEGILMLLAIKDHKHRASRLRARADHHRTATRAACCAASGRFCGREITAARCWRRRSSSGSRIAQAKGVELAA